MPDVKIYIVFYSMYGHIYKLAQAIKEGAESVTGVTVELFQVAETLPAEVLEKMHAPPKPDVPVITAAQLADADALIFGTPTRYGAIPAQMKTLWDATGQLWQKGALVGKPATTFFSTATQGGGQETTAFTSLTHFAHHGLIYVPIGYSSPLLFNNDEVHGGSPYGAGTIAGGDGSRQPTELELSVARHQGKYFAGVAKKLA